MPACRASVDDAVPATSGYCEVQPSEFAPPASVGARTDGTRYHLHMLLDDSFVPGTSQIFNNHIPLDLDLDESVTVSKTTPLLNVSRGQLVPYVITVTNGIGVNLPDVTVVDRPPAGFRYVEGSARLDGVPAEPQVNGRELVWTGLTVTADGRHTIVLLLGVGSGVGEGEFVNRAQAMNLLTGRPLSSEASATVRIVPDPTLDCTDVIGKVFDDVNRNGLQDGEEPGLPGVRLATARGLLATTDRYGRFHITCAVTPREGRGSNFVLKLDDRTLPSGYRSSTQSLQMKRATRGKALEFNFGASINRVIGLDISDPVFEPGAVEMRDIWKPRLDLLLTELRNAPAVLRLSYLADLEDRELVERRVSALQKQIMDAWRAQPDCCLYELVVEREVFWRRGAPPDEPAAARATTGVAHDEAPTAGRAGLFVLCSSCERGADDRAPYLAVALALGERRSFLALDSATQKMRRTVRRRLRAAEPPAPARFMQFATSLREVVRCCATQHAAGSAQRGYGPRPAHSYARAPRLHNSNRRRRHSRALRSRLRRSERRTPTR